MEHREDQISETSSLKILDIAGASDIMSDAKEHAVTSKLGEIIKKVYTDNTKDKGKGKRRSRSKDYKDEAKRQSPRKMYDKSPRPGSSKDSDDDISPIMACIEKV